MNRRMRSLHRSMGAIVAIFVLMLATTGILLNHTSDLNLDKRYLTWGWLLEHYGMGNVEPDTVYLLDRHTVSQFGPQVFIDATPVTQSQLPILGGIIIDDLMVLATEDSLLLFTPEGEFIERMGSGLGIPSMIQNIGLFHGDPVVQTRNGMWRSDFMLDQWEQLSLDGVGWSEPQTMPRLLQDDLASYFHGKGISIERVVLDLHNGHILGKYGIWFADLLGGFLVLISMTGLWLWARRF
ncbi:MAG: PepSY domain-containing protein [Gammaproteobacteria bacterium]|nr:PepSY domain-containing protein [Gammaproteobacteria bacterium]